MIISTSAGLKLPAFSPRKITRRRRLRKKKVSATRSSSRRRNITRRLLAIDPFQRLKPLPNGRGEGEFRRFIQHRHRSLPVAAQIIGARQILHCGLIVGKYLEHSQEALLSFGVLLLSRVSETLQNI